MNEHTPPPIERWIMQREYSARWVDVCTYLPKRVAEKQVACLKENPHWSDNNYRIVPMTELTPKVERAIDAHDDLVEALQVSLKAIESFLPHSHVGKTPEHEDEAQVVDNALDTVKAALAKAEKDQ